MTRRLVWIVPLATCLAGCLVTSDSTRDEQMKKKPLSYKVRRLPSRLKINADWNKAAWREVEPLTLENYMGEKPEHRPKVQAKLAYDDEALYVIFHVEDRYVRAVARKYHDSVCKDSCVEFFFTPGTDLGRTYFNVEINCGGTMLFSYNPEDGKRTRIDPADCDKVKIAHTMPKIVEPEITEPTTWTLEYRLPMEVILKYCPRATKPAPGVRWKANLYKCADATSHPHWLTWSFVDFPRPRFHMPECFGTLEFE